MRSIEIYLIGEDKGIKPICRLMRTFLFYVCFFMIPVLAGAQTTVAIGDFQNRTNRIYLDSWEQKIPEFLQSELSGSSEIVLVERQSLQAILEEQALTMTGLVDSSTAQEVGRLLSAQYVITGTIHMSGNRLRIDARVINVSTGKIVSEKVQSRNEKHLDRMVTLLGDNLRYQLTGRGEYNTRILLRRYPTRYFLASTLGCAVATVFVHNEYVKKRDEYRRAEGLEDFDPTYTSANRLHRTRVVLTYLTGLSLAGTLYCWLRNLTPEEILAARPSVLPYVMSSKRGEVSVGLCFSF